MEYENRASPDNVDSAYDSYQPERPVDGYRRRSPPYERRGGHRRRERSRSPGGRFDGRDRRDRDRDRDRDDRRRPPQDPNLLDRYVPGETQVPIRTNPLPNPLSLDYQVGFTWYAEWWRTEQQIKEDMELSKTGRRPSRPEWRDDREKEKALIQAGYDLYKQELQAKLSRVFVQSAKSQEWFKERYVPEQRAEFKSRLVSARQENLDQWERDLDAGVFDEFTLEGIYKSESDGTGGVNEREEGETVGAAEVLGVGDLVPTRGGDIKDDSASQPSLLIKTIAPSVSRTKIEDFCREHLGEGEGGFKWLSLSDPNPSKKFHRMGWIILKPGNDDEMELDREHRDTRNGEATENGMNGEADEKPQPRTSQQKAVEAVNGKTITDEQRGNFVCHVGIHTPASESRKKALWDLFSSPERIERDLDLARRVVQKFVDEGPGDSSTITKIEERVERLADQGVLQQLAEATSGRGKKKAATPDPMQDFEDEEEGAEDEGAVDEEEIDDVNLQKQKKTLDLFVEYLRRVHHFCLFCVFEADSVHELQRKCANGHLRRPRASLNTASKNAARASALGLPLPESNANDENGDAMLEDAPQQQNTRGGRGRHGQQLYKAFNWVKTYEEKLLQILEPENVDIVKLGGRPLEDALTEELHKWMKQEDEAKFRCKVPECTKLFKGENFWRKHMEKRHPEFYENIRRELVLINNYVLDPAHIAPSRTDATSNGHFSQAGQFTQGTPRGFNLAQAQNNMAMQPYMQNGMQSQGMYGGMPPYGGPMMQMPMGFQGPGPMMMDPGRGGPVRRGHMGHARMGGQMRGPYERPGGRYGMPGQNRGGFQGPGGQMNGQMSMGGGLGAAPRFGDRVGMGPAEAVQGRTLRSYQDLDAVGSGGAGGTGDMNY